MEILYVTQDDDFVVEKKLKEVTYEILFIT